jgi:hypothetical protein
VANFRPQRCHIVRLLVSCSPVLLMAGGQVINPCRWIAYGVAIRNAYVLPANLVGLAAGLYFCLQVVPLLPQAVRGA